MALYKCNSCGEEVAYGLMPTTTCGLLMIPAFLAACCSPFVAWPKLHWCALLLPVPVFFVALFVTFVIPEKLEWVCLGRHACPKCGKRKWSQPFTRGFGL